MTQEKKLAKSAKQELPKTKNRDSRISLKLPDRQTLVMHASVTSSEGLLRHVSAPQAWVDSIDNSRAKRSLMVLNGRQVPLATDTVFTKTDCNLV